MSLRARCVVGTLLVLLASRDADSEPAPFPDAPKTSTGATKIKTDEMRWLCVPGVPVERCIELPAGRFMDEPTWLAVDAEFHRLQDAETRLGAENASLRDTAKDWQPGWKLLAVTFAAGIVGGALAYRHYAN